MTKPRYSFKFKSFKICFQGPHNLNAASSCITMPAGGGKSFTAPEESTRGRSGTVKFTVNGYLKVDEAKAVEKHLTELLVSGTAHVT